MNVGKCGVDEWGGCRKAARFLPSRIFELLGEVLVKFDQNAPNLHAEMSA